MLKRIPPFYLICLFSLFPSCKDESPRPHDYRDEFTGTYRCHKVCSLTRMNPPETYETFNDTLSVSVSKHPGNKNRIIVDADTVPIDSSGKYSGFGEPAGYKSYSISFTGRNILINTFSGGLAGGISCETKGEK